MTRTITKFMALSVLLVSLAVPGFAQQKDNHPLLKGMPQSAQAQSSDQPGKVNPNATTPAQPGAPDTNAPGPAVTPATPGNRPIIIDPSIIQQLLGGQADDDDTPTPEQLEAVYHKVWSMVGKYYHDPAALQNWQVWQSKYDGKLKTADDLEKALQEMLSSLDDPWTKYVSTAEIAAQRKNSQAGISSLGISIVKIADGNYRVDYLFYGAPAYASPLKKGDVIKSVGGKPLKGLPQHEAEDLLSGKDGSPTTLVYERDGKEEKLNLTFKPTPDSEVEANILPGNIGYVRLNQFDNDGVLNLLKALTALHQKTKGNLAGLVFDLRGNPGGEFTLALEVASIFIEKGTVVTSTTRDGRMVTHESYEVIPPQKHDFGGADADEVQMIKDYYTVPMVVLVNGSTASSAEIVTGALKDSGRATIIGTTTYGKGVGYTKNRIPPGGILLITSLDYLTPSGYNLSHKGIAPQVVAEQTPGSKTDEQLARAVDLLKKLHPDPLGDGNPTKNARKTLGESDWLENPLVACAAVGFIMLVVVLFARHHVLSRGRREAEARQARDESTEA